MTEETAEKLRALLKAYGERKPAPAPLSKTGSGSAERKRRACADCLRNIVRPVLDAVMAELKSAGHDASTRDTTERDDAHPSVALSFTPRVGAAKSPEVALASALMFKCDPRRGILVQRDVKASPAKPRAVTATSDRIGTIGVDAVSTQWVERKTLTFVEDVLKAN